MKNLFSILIALTIACLANAQSYLPTTGGTLTGNLIINPGNQIQVPYLGLNAGNNPPANSSNVSIFPNNTTVTLDIVGWSNGWNFIPVGQTPYPGPVVSIDNNGNIRTNGNVGIGTNTPLYKLTLAGGDIKAYNYDNNSGICIGAEGRDMPRIGFHVSDNSRRFKIQFSDVNQPSERLGIYTSNGGALPEIEAFSVVKAGNVGIGITNPQQKLAVNGTIQAKEVNVTTTGWPDYVFQPEYQLPPLESLATQIKAQGHLPNIPSAEDVSKNGVALGEMNKKLLEKVEELTLYIIKQNEENKKQNEKIERLEKENQQFELLKHRIEKLENKQ